jgi:SAM-dependent methyltransferase
MKLITGVQEFHGYDRRFFEKTKSCYLRTGSLSRLREKNLHRWGVGLTDELIAHVRTQAEWYYREDLRDRENHPEVDTFFRTEWRKDCESQMVQCAGQSVKELLKSLSQRREKIHIAEIPARSTPASFAVAVEMWNDPDTRDLFDRTTFHLVNNDSGSLKVAKKKMEQYMANYQVHSMLDTDFLAQSGGIDIIISVLHLHKNSSRDFVLKVHRSLIEGGVLVMADFNSTLWDHPINLCNFLGSVGAEYERDEIIAMLDPELMRPDPKVGLTREEAKANEHHLEHLREVYARIGRFKPSIVPRMHILGAYRTSQAQREELEEGGLFTCDTENAIKAEYPESKLVSPVRLISGSDIANFMLAMKLKSEEGR